jgi:ribosomal protein L29
MTNTTTKEEYNPSLKDLERSLAEERNKLATYSFPKQEDKIKIISKIRVLRSSIEMLTAYKSYIHS